MRKWQYFTAFAPPLTEALILDVFSFYVCSSLHQKQRKPQEIAACISRKYNYLTGSPIHTAQKTPLWALASLMKVVISSQGVFSFCRSASKSLKKTGSSDQRENVTFGSLNPQSLTVNAVHEVRYNSKPEAWWCSGVAPLAWPSRVVAGAVSDHTEMKWSWESPHISLLLASGDV